VTDIPGEQKAILQFSSGPHRRVGEPDELSVTATAVSAATAFSDVGPDRRRSFPQLRRETEALVVRKARGEAIHLQSQLVRPLPHLELAKAFHE
jgi:hypothetical protein